MDLILWRHAEAGDNLADPVEDLERPLKPKGERQAQRVADCTQTAAALGRRVKKVAALGPDGSVEGLLAAVRWPDSKEAVLVVGHQPTLGMAAAYLMAGDAARFGEPWSIKKGSVWWLRHRPRPDRSEVQIVAVRTAEGL